MATLFWVGGSTAYDGVTNRLATTTGGAATVAVISAADTVTFDANSPAAAVVTTTAAISCTTLNIGAGFTGSITLGNTLTASANIVHNTGGFNSNGFAVTCSSYSSVNSNVRAITLGTSTVTCNGASGGWLINTATNLTLSAASSTINITGSNASFAQGAPLSGGNFGTINMTGSGVATWNVAGTQTYATVNRTGTASVSDSFSLAAGNLGTVNGALILAGNSAANRLLVTSNVSGTARTITLGASATCKTSGTQNVDFADITMSGGATNERDLSAITGGSGDALGNTGITFTTPITQTHSASSGANWSDAASWPTRIPLPQDSCLIDVNTTGLFTADMVRLGANIDFTGFAGTFRITGTGGSAMYGSLTLATTMSFSGATALTMSGRGTHTITSNGRTMPWQMLIAAPGGSYTLQDDLSTSSTSVMSFQAGAFIANNFNLTAQGYTLSSTLARTVLGGTGTWNCTRTSATTFWTLGGAGALTMDMSQATIALTATSTLVRTFAGTNAKYGTLTYTVAGSTGTLLISGNNTISTINFSDASNARTLQFTAASTNIIGTRNIFGTTGKLMTINSSTAATPAILQSRGNWNIGTNSTLVSGNTGLAVAASSEMDFVSAQDITGNQVSQANMFFTS